MKMLLNLRLLALLAIAVSAVSSFAQSVSFGSANQIALNASPGFIYKADLKQGLTSAYYEFQIVGTDNMGHLVRVSAATGVITRNRSQDLDSGVVRSAPIMASDAAAIAVNASWAKYGIDTMAVRAEVRLRNGSLRWKIQLNVPGDGGAIDDEDIQVTLDGNGNVLKVERLP